MSAPTSLRPLDATTVERAPLPVTVLQFGAGNFLRGFADQMIQVANDAGVMHDGVGIVHATPRHAAGERSGLRAQDGLFHVVLEGVRDGVAVRETTLVDCVRAEVFAHGEFERYRELYLSPDLRLVLSNTTEAGIVWAEDDLAARPPASFPAKVTALLHDRFVHFAASPGAGLAFVCCELIEDNATVLRDLVLRHAARAGLGEEFARWVREACTFHDSLVDRIVPGFPRDDIDRIQAETGFEDRFVVKGELYAQWVIGGDPVVRDLLPLDRAGLPVQFVPDVRPSRTAKVRILNGQHTALAPVGLLLGCTSVREAVEHADVAQYLRRLVETEILPSIPGAGLDAFSERIAERFRNPFLDHRLSDIMLNAVSKWRARSLPVLLAAIERGERAPLTALGFAATVALFGGLGAPPGFVPRDDAGALTTIRRGIATGDLPGLVRHVAIAEGFLTGDDARLPAVVDEIASQLRRIRDDGIAVALRSSLG